MDATTATTATTAATAVTTDRMTARLLLVGAGLGILANLLHPVFSPDTPMSEFLATAAERPDWFWLHEGLLLGLCALAAGLVLVARRLLGSPGAAWAVVGAVLTIVGLGLSAVQIGVLDAVVVPQLDELEPGGGPTTELVALLDRALLSMQTFLAWGLGGLSLGIALMQAVWAQAWVRWTLVVSGAVGAVVGLLMLLEVADGFTFVAFRVSSTGLTIAAIGIAVALRRDVAARTVGAAQP